MCQLHHQAQNITYGTVAEPDPMTQLLLPRQSKAVRTVLRQRFVQLAGSYVRPPGDVHTHVICECLRGADQIRDWLKWQHSRCLLNLSQVLCVGILYVRGLKLAREERETGGGSFPTQLSRMFKRTMCLFGSTYLCEKLFSTLNFNKSKYRSRLTDEHLQALLRVSTASSLKPNVARLYERKRCQISSSKK
ncbi:hypothetical protein SRHO_G00342210 [Serrasalmus rhombeus]